MPGPPLTRCDRGSVSGNFWLGRRKCFGLFLWLLGMIGTYTIGAWLHLLLVIALIVLIIQLVTGRTSAV